MMVSEDSMTSISPSTLRVGLADDDPVNQAILKKILKSLLPPSAVIDVYSNGLECVLGCKNQNYDVLFLDIDMPVMTGVDAIKSLRNPDSPLTPPTEPSTASSFLSHLNPLFSFASFNAFATESLLSPSFTPSASSYFSSNPLPSPPPDRISQTYIEPSPIAPSYATIPIIAVTSSVEPSQVQSYYDAGFNTVIPKPATLSNIRHALNSLPCMKN